MNVTIEIELSEAELDELKKQSKQAFLSADDMAAHLSQVIRRELAPGVDIGWLYRATYYREEPGERHGYRMYQHTFMGPNWPHVDGRPRLYCDGKNLRSRGGAFIVDASRGILDSRESGSERV